MDPNTILDNIRNHIAEIDIELARENDDKYLLAELAVELRDSVESLDEWMSTGGFAPNPWTHKS